MGYLVLYNLFFQKNFKNESFLHRSLDTNALVFIHVKFLDPQVALRELKVTVKDIVRGQM